MRFPYGIFIYSASLSFIAQAQNVSSMPPLFEEYKAPIVRHKTTSAPKLESSQDLEFKSKIAEASRQRVNFAGHYVLSSFGCGANCVMSFALDKHSGKVSWLPFTVCCWDEVNSKSIPMSFRKDSRLVVIIGSRNEEGKGTYYYEFSNFKFILVHSKAPWRIVCSKSMALMYKLI